MKTGVIMQSTGANQTVNSDGEIYYCTIRGKLRLKEIKSTNPVAVGDIVDFEIVDETNNGIITKIHERKNCIVRKSTNLSKSSHIIATNIDQAIFIFTMRNPFTSTVFLDRFLVAAESYSIPTTILFNKIDIYKEEEFEEIANIMAIYDEIGYKIIETSVTRKYNLDAVKDILRNKISLISGHSGVGKSSLINAIAPEFNLKIAEISDYHKSGKHTTTFAQMLPLPFGGFIIDTPGIRGFGIINIKKDEIYHFFPEIFKVSENCRYYNCTHVSEPDCAVKKAVEDGEIAWSRYKSYLNIVLDEDEKHRVSE
jgi:ribosome biogenesis GTPase